MSFYRIIVIILQIKILEEAFYDHWYSEILPLPPLIESLVFRNHYIKRLSKAFTILFNE